MIFGNNISRKGNYMIRIIISSLFAISVSVCVHASHDSISKKKTDYASMKDVANALQFARSWNDVEYTPLVGPVAPIGYVIVGRLNIPKDARVSARIPIYDDGSYCTAISRGRKLFFFAHGYKPLEITPSSKIATNVYNAGLKSFIKAKPDDIRQLEAKITAAHLSNGTLPITCSLQISNYKYLWQDHGNRCGAPITVEVASQRISSGAAIKFEQLSRIPYVLVITAPGYIKQELTISETKDGIINMGKICLMPAKKILITYRARVRQKDGKWISDDALKTAVISCDGSSEFLFSNQRDGLGNSLELRMSPKENIVKASFFYYQPNSFYNLGARNIKDIKGWKAVDISRATGSTEAVLQNNKLYYFRINDINGTDIELLFHVVKQ
jgi:hypothetical protein